MRLFMLFAASLFVLGCGGSDSDDKDTQQPENDAVQDVLDVSDDQDMTETRSDPDAVDAADAAQPELTPSETLLNLACGDYYCHSYEDCVGDTLPDDCKTQCKQQAAEDTEFMVRLLCAYMSDDFCEAWGTCEGTLPEVTEPCRQLCDSADSCQALDSEMLGFSLDDCKLECTIWTELMEADTGIVDCMNGALETCAGVPFLECVGMTDQLPMDACQSIFCDETQAQECGQIPGSFEDVEACKSQCEDWTGSQALGAANCLEMQEGLPVGCGEVAANCMNIEDTLPEDAVAFAKVFRQKCTVDFDFGVSGGLADNLMAWMVYGLTLSYPDLFQEMSQARTCIEELSFCPPAEASHLFCLYDAPEDARTKCAALKDVCEDEIMAQEYQMECQNTAAFVHQFSPDDEQGIYDCLDGATTCEEKAACFTLQDG